MPQSEPGRINQVEAYRPPCSKCGGPTKLASIEPTASNHHDNRTFECSLCGNADSELIKFK